jgi:hypothetical protein
MVVGEFGVVDHLAREVQNDFRRRCTERRRAVFIRRVRPQRRTNHRPARCQRSPRPPDVQRGNMPVPDGFLAPRVRGDALDRQVNFDEAFGVIHLATDFAEFVRI